MSDSPRPSEMSLSIKIGEHAVDVAGPVHEVWKVLEVFQRLSGFDPYWSEREAKQQRYETALYANQMQQMIGKINPPMLPATYLPGGGYAVATNTTPPQNVQAPASQPSQIDVVKQWLVDKGEKW